MCWGRRASKDCGKGMRIVIGRYRDISYEVVEADMAPEGLERVRAKFEHLCECYLPDNADALRTLFAVKQIARCYTFLPADMSADLRNRVLSNEYSCWQFDHFSENTVVLRPNVIGGTVVWRYVSQYCLKERLLQFLRSDISNVCALGGGYNGTAIEKEPQAGNETGKEGNLLCFGEVMLKDPIPLILDSEYFDTFGFMTRLPAAAFEVGDLTAGNFTEQHADEMILASSCIFMEIHEGEGICIMDLEACSGAAVLDK